MSTDEEKERHRARRVRNYIAKRLRDRAPYSMKVVNPRKTDYKRKSKYNQIENED